MGEENKERATVKLLINVQSFTITEIAKRIRDCWTNAKSVIDNKPDDYNGSVFAKIIIWLKTNCVFRWPLISYIEQRRKFRRYQKNT